MQLFKLLQVKKKTQSDQTGMPWNDFLSHSIDLLNPGFATHREGT